MSNTDDVVAITQLINLYAAATDTLQWELFDRVFTPDVRVDFGGPAAFTGLDVVKGAFEAIHRPFRTTQHFTSNIHVHVAGDAATCLSYVRGVFVREVEGGTMFESTGWYDDRLVRTADGWRIAHRSSRMTWWGGNPEVLRTQPEAGPPARTDSLAEDGPGLDHMRALHGG